MLTDIKAVIFDMDGTIIDSLWVWEQVDIDFLSKRNLELPSDLREVIEGFGFLETAVYFKDRFHIEDSVEEIMNEWNEMVEEYYHSIIKIKKGVKEFLTYLKDNNYKIGIATSNYRNLIEPVLIRNDINTYFDIIVTTDEVPRNKSFPDVFLEAAKRLCVSPQECLVFEDTLCAIQGAKAAGMKVAAVYDEKGSSTPQTLSEAADHLIDDFETILRSY